MPAQRLSCRDRDSLGLRSLLVAMPPQRVQETAIREGECNGGCIDEEEEGDDDGGDEACWVTYGRRGRMRRLPPPLPSLLGAMRRTRTEDGRLVITEAPAGARRPEYIRARRCGGRVTMQIVESKDFYPFPAPAGPSPAQEDDNDILAMRELNDTSTAAAVGEGNRGHMQKAAAPPPLPGVGCFEDVVKYHSIGSASPHQIVRVRMVH